MRVADADEDGGVSTLPALGVPVLERAHAPAGEQTRATRLVRVITAMVMSTVFHTTVKEARAPNPVETTETRRGSQRHSGRSEMKVMETSE